MPVDLNALVDVIGASENAAATAVNQLNGDSTAAQLTKASLEVNKYNLVATAVTQLIKADSEAKTAAARAISR